MAQPRTPLAGSDIIREIGISSGTLYPILGRLENAGWLESCWEAGDPRKLGRPRKRLYQVTGIGSASVERELESLFPNRGSLRWT